MNSANWMIQAIEQRRQTMLKVMNFIVDRQRAFFEKGVEYLKPLTLREVADVISMHESTVSRVTNEKYVQTPRGVLPLKFFFSSALSTASGREASARSIRAKLQKMVGRGRSRKTAHRPADRAPLPGAGHPDRTAYRRQVPRPARNPAGPDAQAGMTRPTGPSM
jgi:DNA-directed RNA polymerase specialized sigma54-like protein